MPIQNIDNYLMPSRSQEASILKSHGENRVPVEQQFLTGEVNQRAERNLTRTNEAEKTDTDHNGFDAKKRGRNQYDVRPFKKRKKASSKKSFETIMGDEGRTIDIKL